MAGGAGIGAIPGGMRYGGAGAAAGALIGANVGALAGIPLSIKAHKKDYEALGQMALNRIDPEVLATMSDKEIAAIKRKAGLIGLMPNKPE